jgi:hypothetical protein
VHAQAGPGWGGAGRARPGSPPLPVHGQPAQPSFNQIQPRLAPRGAAATQCRRSRARSRPAAGHTDSACCAQPTSWLGCRQPRSDARQQPTARGRSGPGAWAWLPGRVLQAVQVAGLEPAPWSVARAAELRMLAPAHAARAAPLGAQLSGSPPRGAHGLSRPRRWVWLQGRAARRGAAAGQGAGQGARAAAGGQVQGTLARQVSDRGAG